MTVHITTVSELKAKLAGLLAGLESGAGPVYVTQHGKPRAVLVRYEDYEALYEKLDDLEDALAMHGALSSPEEESVSLEAYDSQRSTSVHG
jgi:prevent-host-death family protein